MFTWNRFLGFLGSATVLLGDCILAGPAFAHTAPAAVVYVETNTASQNAVLAFRRLPDLSLVPLAGSPYPTGGKGVFDLSLKLGPFDSDQNIVVNPERTLLFAVNSGSNSIAVFHIAPDGSLTAVKGSPFPSGGINPVSVGLSRDTLMVVNKAMDPGQGTVDLPNYAAFRITVEGALVPGALSVHPTLAGSSPSQALISPSGRLLFGADFLGGLLESFLVEADGSLTQNTPQALPDSEFSGTNVPHAPLGLWAHPSRPVLYVGFVTINRLGVYSYDPTGELTFVHSVPNSGKAICWVRTNPEGTRLYTSNTNDSSISVYETSNPLKPKEIQKHRLSGVGNSFQFELDPRGGFLYVLTQRGASTVPLGKGNTLHVLQLDPDGRIADKDDSPLELTLPQGTRPQGVAVF
jgi:6-phosphogluconolactonase (cycloisomerase 2 family)